MIILLPTYVNYFNRAGSRDNILLSEKYLRIILTKLTVILPDVTSVGTGFSALGNWH